MISRLILAIACIVLLLLKNVHNVLALQICLLYFLQTHIELAFRRALASVQQRVGSVSCNSLRTFTTLAEICALTNIFMIIPVHKKVDLLSLGRSIGPHRRNEIAAWIYIVRRYMKTSWIRKLAHPIGTTNQPKKKYTRRV